jgi:hypothetical protein
MMGQEPGEGGAEPRGLPGGSSLEPEDRAFLERCARWLGERRLATPAVLFLESTKPLNFVGSQFLFFFEPMVRAVVDGKGYSRFAGLMEDRDNVEEFLQMIERSDQEIRSREKETER